MFSYFNELDTYRKKIVFSWGAFGSILELSKMVLTLIRNQKINIQLV